MTEKQRRALRPDAQPFDEIRITTVPRYKTSGMSGDEWRISASVQLLRKGVVVHETGFRNVETAIMGLGYTWLNAIDEGKAYFAGEADTCDQEGCKEIATVTYRIKKTYCNEPYIHEALDCGMSDRFAGKPEVVIRKFCERHSSRGDCGFEDSDQNYEKVEGESSGPRACDIKPSTFGGTVSIEEN